MTFRGYLFTIPPSIQSCSGKTQRFYFYSKGTD